MPPQRGTSGGLGLEGSCGSGDSWITTARFLGGVELFAARLAGEAYRRHRHDTYAVCVTTSGVQLFDYRGATHVSTPGQVVVLYPDEAHDGRPGDENGFAYRMVYVMPAVLSDAVRTLVGAPAPLPYVPEPVSWNRTLARAVHDAFDAPGDSFASDSVALELAAGLLAAARRASPERRRCRSDASVVERARQFLDAERLRVVHSAELEALVGVSRYELCRQFRAVLGTSPHRYLLMRRLEFARDRLAAGRPLADVACEAGFADQAHFTRVFGSAFGLTPARFRRLSRPGGTRPGA